MITKKQLHIFEQFAKRPFETQTLKKVKEHAREKSNNALAIAMKQFKKENILTEKKVGRSSLYKLNFDNECMLYYLALANHQRISNTVRTSINRLKKEVERYTLFYSMVIFGSYAEKKQQESSDLDVAIFIEKENHRKKVQAAVNSAELKSLLPIDAHIITKDAFLQMIERDEENLGKQIVRKHIAVHNHPLFYTLVRRGIKDELRI